ncbi:MAG: tRNA (N(6)-L-threonylcarbamoyladenosine(37)-C(2))-methylthiotransferase MtaB [Chloroflexi bacterium]|nr:tRNA (N(6)-L-threonylcarbamoyladenosine(37)-C(2))-methylthiotransferase MtaB [Chloroflexota bacterium]
MSKISIESLGCKLNQAETESFAWRLLGKGYQLAESAEEADIYVLNTCTVTHVADRKARHLLRSAQRANPQALIVAVGCYAQRAPEELRQLGVVDLILDNQEKERLAEVLTDRSAPIGKGRQGPVMGHQGRSRSLIKIQEGCNSFCSFCVVPYTRGRERSRPWPEVLHEVREREDAGYKEVILTGTKIGTYRWNGESHGGLVRLIGSILEETNVERLRLSSLQPQDLTPELIDLWADDRLCPHLHLPLQSGSQAMLERMGRGYSLIEYERAVCRACQAIPNLAITTDVMVGFPGEGEKEFEESYRFCERMGFAKIHVFPYSARCGTAAATLPGQVNGRVKRDRSQQMLALAEQSARCFREGFLGQTMTVLWESQLDEGIWGGLTANYLRVFARSEEDLTNRLLKAKLVAEQAQGLMGELAQEDRDG